MYGHILRIIKQPRISAFIWCIVSKNLPSSYIDMYRNVILREIAG